MKAVVERPKNCVRFKPFRLVRGSDLRAAFETLSDEELRSLFRSIWSHASPCCSTFSTMSTSKHGRAQWNEYCGVTEEAWHANRILWILADVLVQRHKAFGSRAKFTLENPQTQAFALHPAVQFLCKETRGRGGEYSHVHFLRQVRETDLDIQ